jgi:NAD+ synthase (glutamine-hydrolysing)
VIRTPALYGAAALLQTHGYRSVVVGTTNRDEGSYLGFFGKASGGMVDLLRVSLIVIAHSDPS